MSTIRARDYITSGFSADDATALAPAIDEAKSSDSVFAIDFEGVQFFTTLFFSTALTYLVGTWGPGEYDRRMKIVNLSDSGQETYKHALDYAIRYYEKNSGEREVERRAVLDAMEG